MKDYKKLQERINKEKQITIGDITDLGYSRYDINQFIEAGILKRSKRGLYDYLPELEHVETKQVDSITEEETPTKSVTNDNPVESNENQEEHDTFYYVNEGIRKVLKREYSDSITSFKSALEINPNNSNAKIGLIGAYVFLEDYERAYIATIDFYKTRNDNSLLYNVYYYLLVLSEHTSVDNNLLNEVKEEIKNNRDTLKKLNTNFKRLHIALDNKDYLEALKYINFSLAMDRKAKKYYITSHIHKSLIMATLRLKGIDPYEAIIKAKEQAAVNTTIEEKTEKRKTIAVVEEIPVPEETEEVVVVPQVDESIVKVNVLLEAINNNDYELALNLLKEDNIEEPMEVIKVLLSKLSAIKSLITSPGPVKVVTSEPVRVVTEDSLVEDISEEEVELAPTQEADTLPIPAQSEELIEVSEQREVLEETPITESHQLTPEELADIAYKAYKDSYHSEQFDEATKNLRRYEYLNNSKGTPRNIKYHYIRIEKSKKDFEQNPERYLKKKALVAVIFNLKKEKRYEAALAAILEYKSLGGIRNDLILICEAEIYYLKNDFASAQRILSALASYCEEPSFYTLSSKVAFNKNRFQDALNYCLAYNERRPNTTPNNYQLMGDCYGKLGKSGKAIKAYRKAEQIAEEKGYRPLDLSGRISHQEMRSETKKEERTTRYLEKKK